MKKTSISTIENIAFPEIQYIFVKTQDSSIGSLEWTTKATIHVLILWSGSSQSVRRFPILSWKGMFSI